MQLLTTLTEGLYCFPAQACPCAQPRAHVCALACMYDCSLVLEARLTATAVSGLLMHMTVLPVTLEPSGSACRHLRYAWMRREGKRMRHRKQTYVLGQGVQGLLSSHLDVFAAEPLSLTGSPHDPAIADECTSWPCLAAAP